eukprot:scaffold169859_cov33-Tisochrysis_lutea.AAC.4
MTRRGSGARLRCRLVLAQALKQPHQRPTDSLRLATVIKAILRANYRVHIENGAQVVLAQQGESSVELAE